VLLRERSFNHGGRLCSRASLCNLVMRRVKVSSFTGFLTASKNLFQR